MTVIMMIWAIIISKETAHITDDD